MASEDDRDQKVFGVLLIFILIAGPLILTLITMAQFLRAASSVATRSCCKEEAPLGNGNLPLESGGTMDLAGAGSAMNLQAAAPSDGLIHASFPDGPMGFQIHEEYRKFVVTKSSGVAKEQGVEIGDVLVQIGTVVLADELKDVENDQRFNEVSRMIGTFPRPVAVVFAKAPDGGGKGGQEEQKGEEKVTEAKGSGGGGTARSKRSISVDEEPTGISPGSRIRDL